MLNLKIIDDYLGFLLLEKGEDILYNGESKKALVSDARDKISFYDDKFIRTDFEIKTGDLIDYQDSKWIVISEVDKNRLSYKARIRKSNYKIKIVVNEELYEFDSIISSKSLSISTDKYMSFEDGSIDVVIAYNNISRQIDVEMRFIKMQSAWKIVGVDKSKLGIITLQCEKDLFVPTDDKENEIANADKLVTYTLSINEEIYEVAQGETYQYTATIYKDGLEDSTKTVSWRLSNDNATITTDGIVEGINIGTVTITAYISDKPEIFDSIDISIIEAVPEEVITYKMWSSYADGSGENYTDFTVTYGSTKRFGMEKYINGVLATTNDTYTFNLDPNGTSSSNYTYSVIDDYKVEIKGTGMGDTIILTGTSNETGENITKSILLKSLF